MHFDIICQILRLHFPSCLTLLYKASSTQSLLYLLLSLFVFCFLFLDMSMETQNKAGQYIMDGVESREAAELNGGEERTRNSSELVLRVTALVLTLVAAILLGVDKQTKTIPVKLSDNLPALNVAATAKWHHSSAFVFFVVSNSIACAYAALSLLSLIRRKKGLLAASIMILDAVMVGLLFSGIGAAMAIGVVGYKGNSHLQWNKVCNVFGRFCKQVAVANLFSLLGSVAFILLVAVAALRLHRK